MAHQLWHAKEVFHSRLPAFMQLELGSTPAASHLWSVFKNNDAFDDVREKVCQGFGFWSINGGSHTCVSPLRFTRFKAPGQTTPGSRNTTTDCPIKMSLFQVTK